MTVWAYVSGCVWSNPSAIVCFGCAGRTLGAQLSVFSGVVFVEGDLCWIESRGEQIQNQRLGGVRAIAFFVQINSTFITVNFRERGIFHGVGQVE
jgi:hypothetical protein